MMIRYGKNVVLLTALLAAFSPCSFALAADAGDLMSASPWRLLSAVQDGKAVDASDTHATMSFTATMVRFNEDLPTHRKLSYTVDVTSKPNQMTVFFDVGGRRRTIYSCLYVVHGRKLDLTFNPGADMPKTMKSDATNGVVELHFDS